MLNAVVFVLGLVVGIVATALSTAKFVGADLEFWPPPAAGSWQHRTFRALFRLYFSALVALSWMDFHPGSLLRHVVGGAVLVVGFGFALRWTGFLGWRNAFGEAVGLQTGGPYSWSRNPIYVVSIIGMIGWAIAVGSTYLSILLGFWALLYVGAPFLEEPWLEGEYGDAFRSYMEETPRYFRLGPKRPRP